MRIRDWSSDVCSSDLFVILFPNMQARDVQPICKDIIESLNSAALNIGKRFFQLKSAMGVIDKIGRASCRERVCQYVSISVVAVSLIKKQTEITNYDDDVLD